MQRNDLALATAAWNLIHRWFDEPERRAEEQQLGVEAVSLLADLVDATSPPARAELQSRLLALPLAPLAGALAGAEGRCQPDVALALLLERLYGTAEHDELPLLLGRFARRRVWMARGKAAVGLFAYANGLTAPYTLSEGQQLQIP